jgi:hypothetical protein
MTLLGVRDDGAERFRLNGRNDSITLRSRVKPGMTVVLAGMTQKGDDKVFSDFFHRPHISLDEILPVGQV